LKSLIADGHIEMDVSPEGRTGSAIVVSPRWQVLAQGHKGDGTFAWVRIQTVKGPLNIGSIYSPAERGRRCRFWRWLHSLIIEDNWLFYGDFNMLEFHDDSLGQSSVLHGSEERAWKCIVDDLDLLDLYVCASQRKGPLFTRQAVSGARVDGARLDRIYGTSRGEWFHHVVHLHHDGRQMLSDHVPIIAKIALEEPPLQGKRKGTYFKFDAGYLKDATVLGKVKEAWGVRAEDSDPMEYWREGWRRISRIMKAEKKIRQANFRTLDAKRIELEALRLKIELGLTEEEIQSLKKLEAEIRDTERKEAIVWRTKSRIRWLSLGDAPTKYFHAQLRAKHARETIVALETSTGETVTTDEGLLRTVQTEFEQWFGANPGIRANQEGIDNALELVTGRLSPEENQALVAEPSDREILQIVKAMKKEKAPGIDGITSEMLLECWSFLGKDCCAVVHAFWREKQLTRQMIAAVIKLIPKGGARQFLKNWRPLSLLNVPYKVIAKILSNCLKLYLPRLVEIQQTGFIEGRSIQDNI
jgi:hypothetical protein